MFKALLLTTVLVVYQSRKLILGLSIVALVVWMILTNASFNY